MLRSHLIARFTPMIVRWLCLAMSVPVLLVAGCSEVHSPQAGDTNTSWLRSCESHSDCSGKARCLGHLCTLPCASPGLDSCAPLSEAASCNVAVHACDVTCGADQECQTLGTDYSCQAGSCRPAATPALSTETLRINPNRVDGLSGTRVLNTKTVRMGDRFRVGATVWEPTEEGIFANWITNELVHSVYADFVVADIFPDGHVERSFLTNDAHLTSVAFVLGEDGSVAKQSLEYGESPAPAGSPDEANAVRCSNTFYDANLVPLSTQTFPCDDRVDPVTSTANGDWLTWSYEQRDDGKYAALGRYRPREERWLEEPQLTPIQSRRFVSTQLRNEQFSIFVAGSGGETALLTSFSVESSLTAALSDEAWRTVPLTLLRAAIYGPPSDGSGADFRYGDGWLMQESQQNLAGRDQSGKHRVRALPVASAESSEPVIFTLDVQGNAAFHSLAPVPGQDLLALCYAEEVMADQSSNYVLKLAWFNTKGDALGEPVELASSTDDLHECQLTWTGSAFLATWIDGFYNSQQIAYARYVPVR